MAIPCVKRNILLLLLPLLVLLSITPLSSSLSPSDKVTNILLHQLCSTPPIFRDFCISWLSSDPRTFTLDVNGLLSSIIQKTQTVGNNNLAAMQHSSRSTPDPTLRMPYRYCVTDYESAVNSIDTATTKDYRSTSIAAAKAFVSISVCEANLNGRENVPSDVIQRNVVFKRMCNIVRVFSDLLTS
ncbi:hypothetical protein CARUB_v10002788mg [Capsella rubella]|uniref:Pectinesterase inhibitor domain-containing protein n=1 Tax=Capsella rubella TaxID=81985 RepID=R0HB17_9BRAS|nr:pectinesterase inhibitor 1 [Capsella rubella]EOA22205.1 hypothetical protein CARUB_v10002788mg [Capsella rubella]